MPVVQCGVQGDAWHLIMCGLAGGKGIPASVAEHPCTFATLTVPHRRSPGHADPANVRRELREARSEDLAWITSHTFRKTAATTLDEAALSGRLVADQLGHSRPLMTQDVYLGRRVVDSLAAWALEATLRDALPDNENRGKTVAKEEGQRP